MSYFLKREAGIPLGMTNRRKLLCILHRSPPHHGASQVGDFISNSAKLKNNFDCKFIIIKSSTSLESIGKFEYKKIYYLSELYVKILFTLIIFRPDKIYFTASINGFAFYRDLILSTLWKGYFYLKKTDIYYHYHTKGVNDFVSKSVLRLKLTNFFIKDINLILLTPLLQDDFASLTTYKKIYFLPNGVRDQTVLVDFDNFIKDKFSNVQRSINVLYLSNMIKSKGYFKVLELAKQVNIVSVQFHFAGGWQSQKDEYEFFQFIKDNNLSNKVFFHGFVSGNEKQELFKKSHLLLFPTQNESFGLVILEALSYGVPVIATDEGSIPYILNEKIGIVLSDIDNLPQALEEARDTLVNQETSIYCRKHYLDNFTLDKFEDNLISVLKSR
jgi:glycosyltransferase involved in cell wall biosynthesis